MEINRKVCEILVEHGDYMDAIKSVEEKDNIRNIPKYREIQGRIPEILLKKILEKSIPEYMYNDYFRCFNKGAHKVDFVFPNFVLDVKSKSSHGDYYTRNVYKPDWFFTLSKKVYKDMVDNPEQYRLFFIAKWSKDPNKFDPYTETRITSMYCMFLEKSKDLLKLIDHTDQGVFWNNNNKQIERFANKVRFETFKDFLDKFMQIFFENIVVKEAGVKITRVLDQETFDFITTDPKWAKYRARGLMALKKNEIRVGLGDKTLSQKDISNLVDNIVKKIELET
jgi:hypothetical protein